MKKNLLAVLTLTLTWSLQAAIGFTGIDPRVNDWMLRARTNSGGICTTASIVANDTAIKMVYAAGLRSKLLRFSLLDGDRNSSLNPLIRDAGATTDNAFVAMTYSETNGWACANPTEYISTGFNPTNLTTSDAHLGLYLGGTTGAHTWIPAGLTAFGGNDFFLLTSYTGVGAGGPIWAAPYPSAADTGGIGFYVVSRTSSSANGVKVYKDGALVATSASVGGSPPNTGADAAAVMILNCNNGGSALGGAPTTKKAQGYTIGRGLTAADVSALDNIFRRSKTILGR